jgi:hypothetical protein
LTEAAKGTSSFIYYFGWIGSFFVGFFRDLQDIFGAESYAKSASSATLLYYTDFSSPDLGFVHV